MSRFMVDRKLPERSKLQFFFPVASEANNYYFVELPFFENISIKEDKTARYQKYSLISRTSNLYSYLGADSRAFNLEFKMSLPHILETYSNITLDRYLNYHDMSNRNTQAEKDKFLKPLKPKTTPEGIAYRLGTSYTKELAKDSARMVLQSNLNGLTSRDREYFSNKYGIESELSKLKISKNFPEINYVKTTEVQTKVNPDPLSLDPKYKIIDTIIYWTNIIRASVVNNAMNPIYGPPVIRLKHGIMYQDIPCICTNYNIDFDEAAGYDIDTLLPRVLKISLKLEEFRTGDFTEFLPQNKGNSIVRDNVAGWEAVVLKPTHSMDPGYSEFI